MPLESLITARPAPTKKLAQSPRPTSSKADVPDLLKFAALVLQLLLLAILISRFNLESPAFVQLSWLIVGGFVVNYLLPQQYRLGFFLVVSLASLVLVLGWESSAWLMGVGLLLLGLCHAPLPFRARLGLLFGLAALFIAMRAGWVPTLWPVAIWPILGSMFMFRLMVYLYDLRYQTAPTTLTNSLTYFFMLPNVCFPLFPVVDYQTFVRSYYNEDRHTIHQVGARWIFRGVLHLILYRILYKNWSISLYDVANAGDLVHYCLWLFLLYLRVSGQFHIIVGMLHLFGFNLPETHHLYYLASSITDFWRRINIYWKDFMMKLFFYPMYFRLKKAGPNTALIVSTLVVFMLTWLLHAVQWFWLLGGFLLEAKDILFWTILAALVVVNSLWELSHGRQRLTPQGRVTWPTAFKIGLKTLATFTIICALWSMWSSDSLTAWSSLWRFVFVPPTAQGWLLIAATIVAIGGGAVFVAKYPTQFAADRRPLLQESAIRVALMVLLAGVSISAVNERLGSAGKLIAQSRYPQLNQIDSAKLERGYYENLLAVDRFNGELWSLYSKRPPDWADSMIKRGLAVATQDYRIHKLKPSVEGEMNGILLRTNRWGLRDKEYEKEKPPGCYRIAVLGDSHVMAHMVDAEKDFESRLEDQLNHESTGAYKSYEIMNFASNGYRPVAQALVLEQEVLSFKPDALFCVGHDGDASRAVLGIAIACREGVDVKDPELLKLFERAGVDRDTPEPVLLGKLAPYGEEMLQWVYRRIVKGCREHNTRPIFVMMPTLEDVADPTNIRLAQEAGFTVVDLTGCYSGHDERALRVAEWDMHPNELGHKLVADRLFEQLNKENVIPLNDVVIQHESPNDPTTIDGSGK